MSEKIGIVFHQNEKIFCPSCKDHILTFARDAISGCPVEASDIKQEEGQGPWGSGDVMACRKCGHNYSETFQKGK